MRVARTLTTIDAHAAGEPLRIVTSGLPPLRGETLREKRATLRREHDDIRRILLWEPRGHSDMYGAVLTDPTTPEADYGVIFMTNEGYSTMCGHGIIAATTALIEAGMAIKRAVGEVLDVAHPEDPELTGLYGTIITAPPASGDADGRNVTIYANGAIDRSPCGTGTSARMAQLHAKGRLKAGDSFVHESIIGSLFKGRVEREVSVAGKPAIVPSIGGWARQTGLNTIFIDDRDPFAHGFIVK